MSNSSLFRANRAVGAMFFSTFGGIFFAVWYFKSGIDSILVLISIALLTAGILLFAYSTYYKNKDAITKVAETPEKKKADKLFHIINFGQWILILILGNVLVNIGKPDLVIPAAILIIGAHFLPLAKLFKYAPHYITGILLIVWAVVYPFLIGGGNPAGCTVPGLVLWSSALFGLFVKPFGQGGQV
jgi:hypothetical protein